MTDDRMGWIRNIDKLRQNLTDSYISEFEIASNDEIWGMLDYENGWIQCCMTTSEPDHHGLYKYTLRIRMAKSWSQTNIKNVSPKGYMFKGWISGEIITIISFFFKSRFYLTASYSGDIKSIRHKTEYYPILPKKFVQLSRKENKRSFLDLSKFLDTIIKLPEDNHQELILSLDNYAKALREFGLDTELAFVRFVSAIESLSKRVNLRKRDDPFYGKKLENIVNKTVFRSLSGKDRSQLENIFNIRFSKRKFIRFIENHCVGFFKGGNYKSRLVRVNRKGLEKKLKAIYDARSSYLHSGEPMYLSLRLGGWPDWDVDPSTGMILDQRRISGDKKLPYATFFQDLVHHCIMHFIYEITSI